jgi:MFS family permease
LAVKDIWLLAIFYGLNMAGLMTIISLLPINLAERGVTNAGQLVSIMMATSVVFNIAGGILSDKVGKRKPFLIGSALILGCCIIAFGKLTGVPLIIALVISGAALGTIAPVMMVIPVELDEVGPALTATAVGVIFMIGNTGGFIGPVLGGKLMDSFGDFSGFLTMGVALFIAAFVIFPLSETGRKKKAGDDASISVH